MEPQTYGLPSRTAASLTMYRVAKLSVPSTIRSYCSKISNTLSLLSAVLWMTTFTYGLISRTEEAADSALGRPMSLWPWMIWRCRFDSSTVSKSTIPNVPTPAAARYMRAGEPSPPAPTQSTRAFFRRFWPVTPTSGMIRCRE